jgi:hypothetical protein
MSGYVRIAEEPGDPVIRITDVIPVGARGRELRTLIKTDEKGVRYVVMQSRNPPMTRWYTEKGLNVWDMEEMILALVAGAGSTKVEVSDE